MTYSNMSTALRFSNLAAKQQISWVVSLWRSPLNFVWPGVIKQRAANAPSSRSECQLTVFCIDKIACTWLCCLSCQYVSIWQFSYFGLTLAQPFKNFKVQTGCYSFFNIQFNLKLYKIVWITSVLAYLVCYSLAFIHLPQSQNSETCNFLKPSCSKPLWSFLFDTVQ